MILFYACIVIATYSLQIEEIPNNPIFIISDPTSVEQNKIAVLEEENIELLSFSQTEKDSNILVAILLIVFSLFILLIKLL